MRPMLALALLGLLLLAEPVFAAGIPQEQLDSDYKACMQSCQPKNGEEKCKAFCQCTNTEAQSRFTYDEYTKLATDLGRGALADEASVNKLKAIAADCGKKHLAP